MIYKFYKYQGTGNDFIIFDNRDNVIPKLAKETVEQLCDRRFGIGADGLMLLEKMDGYDFKMVYFNSDGNESTMCGNGGRCLVKFAFDLGVVGQNSYFLAVDGPHLAIIENGFVKLGMIDVYDIEKSDSATYMNTGSPHYVEIRESIDKLDVKGLGNEIRYSEKFKPGGTNVNFVELLDNNTIYVRTYERGVEDETYSCGTGVTASAIASFYEGFISPIKVKTKGGDLQVSFETKANAIFENVFLIGPAVKVFEGEVEL